MDETLGQLRSFLAAAGNQEMMLILLVFAAFFVFALGVSFFVMGASDPVRKRLDLLDTAQ